MSKVNKNNSKREKEVRVKQKKYQEISYYNITLVRLMLKRYTEDRGIDIKLGKRNLSYSIVNTIEVNT